VTPPDPSPAIPAAAAAKSRKTAQTAAYFLGFVGLGLTSASLGPTLPSLAEHTHTRLAEVSFLFTARWLGYLFGAVLGGRLYDRVRGHQVMAGGLVLMALTMALAPATGWLALVALVLLVLGLAEGAVDVGGNALLVWVHGSQVGPFMNGLHFFFGVGALLSPVIVAQLVLVSGDIQLPYTAMGLLLLPLALWTARLPSPSFRTAAPDGPAARPSVRLLALFVVFFFICEGAAAGFPGWIYSYAVTLGLGDRTSAAYLTSAYWGAFTLARLLAIPISTRTRPRYILLADLLGGLLSLGVILAWTQSQAATWLATIGLGMSLASLFPTTILLAGRRMAITGQVTGWFFVGASLGNMTFPVLFGQLFDSVGPPAIMGAMAVELVLAVAVLAILIRFARSPGLVRPAPGQAHPA